MFNIGDLIIYSAHGICKIDDIREKTFLGKTRKYYVLHPIENNQKLTISTPVNNKKVVMLDLSSKEESREILKSFNRPGVKWQENANMRSTIYSDIVNTGNRKEIAKVINTLLRKKAEAEANDRKLHVKDQQLLDSASNILFKELAISLGTTAEEINETVLDLIEGSE